MQWTQLFFIANDVQIPKLDVAGSIATSRLSVRSLVQSLSFRSFDSGAVLRAKMLCGIKNRTAIHADGQGLLGQCILATVAILGTLGMLNLQLADLINRETERIPPLRFRVWNVLIYGVT